VFVIGCLGDWRSAAAVLFERHSLSGHPAPSREKRQEVAKTLTRGIAQRYDPETETMISTYSTPAIGNIKPDQVASCISRNTGAGGETQNPAFVVQPSYGIPGNWIGRKPENGGNAVEPMRDVAPCLTKTDRHGVAQHMAVRRLTPVECERLQGFPDNYTNIPWRNKPESPDGPRYKSLGNSMAVPVMKWIGERINQMEAI
jgi:DNA (cytosine-5)-methyltransferase 1